MNRIIKHFKKIISCAFLLSLFFVTGCSSKPEDKQVIKDGLVSITITSRLARQEYYDKYDDWDFSSVNLILHFNDETTEEIPITSSCVSFSYTPEKPELTNPPMYIVTVKDIKYTDYKGEVHLVPDKNFDIWVTKNRYYVKEDIPRLMPLISVFIVANILTVVGAIHINKCVRNNKDQLLTSRNEKKFLIIANDSDSVMYFRKDFILFLKRKGFQVSIITSDDKRKNEILEFCDEFNLVPFDNRSKNPFNFLAVSSLMRKAIKRINPNYVFCFQTKPNTIGPVIANSINIKNIYCMIEGLGDAFQPINFKGKVLRTIISLLYKRSFKLAKDVFVLNRNDYYEILSRKITTSDKLHIINGIGIDLDLFSPSYKISENKTVIMLSRLVINKGVLDYCKIARKVHETRKDIKFELYGKEQQLFKKDIQEYIDDGSIYYGGVQKDVIKLFENSRLLCSTSYREGFPRCIMEAMALAKPVVVSIAIGNVDEVVEDKTGYLINTKDIDGFANKIIEIIDNDELLLELGKNARKICEEKYDSRIINDQIFEIITKH